MVVSHDFFHVEIDLLSDIQVFTLYVLQFFIHFRLYHLVCLGHLVCQAVYKGLHCWLLSAYEDKPFDGPVWVSLSFDTNFFLKT